jgi:hypothetical protein
VKVSPRKVQAEAIAEVGSPSVAPADPELRLPEPKPSGVDDRAALAARGQGFESPLLREILTSRVGPLLLGFMERQALSKPELSDLSWYLRSVERAQLKALEKALVRAVGIEAKQARSLSARPKNKDADLERVLWILKGGLTANVPPDFPPGHPLHGAIDRDQGDFEVHSSANDPQATLNGLRHLAFNMDFRMSRGKVGQGGTAAEQGRVVAAHLLLRARVTKAVGELEAQDQSEGAALARERRPLLLAGAYAAQDLRRDLGDLSRTATDGFVLNLFGINTRPGMTLPGDSEVNVYSPSPSWPARAMADALPAGSVLCDCGSGLGAVCLLYSFLSGRPSIGVERDPALVDRAKSAATEAGLSQVQFVEQDVRTADFSAADAFYFFNPFMGSIMNEVLQRLEEVARSKTIHLIGLASSFDKVPWLERVPHPHLDLWRSRPLA